MSVEQFMARFRPIYPDADLQAYADSLGLISEAVAPEAPPAIPSCATVANVSASLAIVQEEEPVEEINSTATSNKTTKPRGGKK